MYKTGITSLKTSSSKISGFTSDGITIMLIPVNEKNTVRFRISFRFLKIVIFIILLLLFLAFCSFKFLQFEKSQLKKVTLETSKWNSIHKIIHYHQSELIKRTEKLYREGQNLHQLIWDKEMDISKDLDHSYLKKTLIDLQLMPIRKVLRFMATREVVFSGMPVGQPLKFSYITSKYGSRVSPFGEDVAFHTGIDFANTIGTPLYATASGKVLFAGNNSSGYGLYVKILHKYGFMTLYGHCSRLKVKSDQEVKKGDIIGFLGQTGSATGPHLHYEIRLYKDGVNPYEVILNPLPFIQEIM